MAPMPAHHLYLAQVTRFLISHMTPMMPCPPGGPSKQLEAGYQYSTTVFRLLGGDLDDSLWDTYCISWTPSVLLLPCFSLPFYGQACLSQQQRRHSLSSSYISPSPSPCVENTLLIGACANFRECCLWAVISMKTTILVRIFLQGTYKQCLTHTREASKICVDLTNEGMMNIMSPPYVVNRSHRRVKPDQVSVVESVRLQNREGRHD